MIIIPLIKQKKSPENSRKKFLTKVQKDLRKEISKDEIKYDLILDQEDVVFGKKYIENLNWQNQKIIGLHPGSTLSPAALLRRWPVERYAETAKYLIKEKSWKVLIFVGPDEVKLRDKLYNLISDKVNCNLVKNLKFNQTMGILNQVDLLICNDNGFSHLAVALSKKY